MRDLDLEMQILDMLDLNGTIDTYDLENFIKENLELNEEEIEEIIDEVTCIIDEEVDTLKEVISVILADKFRELIEKQEVKEHPEDAPWQLHLFE